MADIRCKYYCAVGKCMHMNDMNEPGECVYGDGVIRENASIHCSVGKKELKIESN